MKSPLRWRLMTATNAVAMTLSSLAPTLAAPPPIAGQTAGSPPGRVGRLARVSGAVSFHTADQTVWSPATLNYPVTTGDALWTEPSAEALVEVSGNRLAMDGATELDVANLDDHALVGTLPQGEVYLNLRAVPNGDAYTIQTPRGAVQVAAVGRYEIVAGDTDHPTTVSVVEGLAQITGTNLTLQVAAGQMASIDGSTSLQGVVGPLRQDPFLIKMLGQERPAARSAVAVPPVVAEMTGSADLDQYGSWADTPQTGTIWYPRVETGWVPYRHGRWSYVAPWGWTWVDDAPWGFAPFHYGRWIETDDRWGWIPADPDARAYPQPVYAPALVSWIDIGAAVAVGAAAGALIAGGDRSVGWVPLGPREPYYPPYSHSLDYVRAVNGPSIRNVNQVITVNNVTMGSNNRTVVQNFINRGGATVVPAGVMARSAPIATAAQPLAAQQFTQTRAQFQPPIAPGAATVGVTPAVARQFNFMPAAPASAAGPTIDRAALRAVGPRGAPAYVPSLRLGERAGAPVPVQAPAPPVTSNAAAGAGPRPAGTPEPATTPERPAAPEAASPGVLPALRPAAPGVEPQRPPGPGPVAGPAAVAPEVHPGAPQIAVSRPPAAPPHAVEPGRPVAAPAQAPAGGGAPRPAVAAAPVRGPEARPAPPTQPVHPAPRPVAAPPPRPVAAPPPRPVAAPPPRPVAAPPPRPVAAPPPRPMRVDAPRPAPAPHAAPRPAASAHPAPREEHH